MEVVSQLRIKATPVFYANRKAYHEGYPIICNEGGSRSGKTYSIMQLLIVLALQSKQRISVVSHSLPHIKRGAYRDFKTIMDSFGIWEEESMRYTDYVYTFQQTGSYIEFIGLEDESRARGPGRDVLFVNEANLIRKNLFDQLVMRTTGTTFTDWNPADFVSWVYDVADNPKNKRIHSTYLNNKSNLSQQQIEYIESYKNLPDDFMWKVYGLGLRGASKEIIYTNWKYYKDIHNGDVFYGLDFGYTNPSALVKVTHYEGANYVEELLYEKGLTLSDLANRIAELVPKGALIYADSAEPKSIEELYRLGYNIKPAEKDVWAGILKVKSYPLHIHEKSSNLASELQSYKWRKDKNDEVTEEPVKENDHLCDAMRYAIFTHMNTEKLILFA